MCSADLNVKVGIADAVAYDLERSACREHREGACEYELAGACDTSRYAHHVCLCDTAVEESVRVSLLEDACLGRCRKVSVEYY